MLRQLRRVIRAGAPRAEERISYGIPLYEHHGPLVFFAGYEHHVGLYPVDPATDKHAKGLERYMSGKATVRFPIGQPLPVTLITKLVKARVKENEAKTKEPSRLRPRRSEGSG